jgi:hypothetical protein
MANKELTDVFHEETGLYYCDTSKMDFKWSDEYVEWLENELSKLRQGAVSGTLPTYNICGGCGADNPSKRCIGCRHVFGNGH